MISLLNTILSAIQNLGQLVADAFHTTVNMLRFVPTLLQFLSGGAWLECVPVTMVGAGLVCVVFAIYRALLGGDN